MMTTPLEIAILIHYYACVGDYPNYHTPGAMDAIKKFIRLGLLKENFCQKDLSQKYIGNQEALDVYITGIREVPLPKQKWVIEEFNKSCKAVQE